MIIEKEEKMRKKQEWILLNSLRRRLKNLLKSLTTVLGKGIGGRTRIWSLS
jgi:hypothetical protein